MASPTYRRSPPAAPHLALPRQRPSLALPTGSNCRKASTASTISSAHPLRQTSFPPPELPLQHQQQHGLAQDTNLAQYSPSLEGTFDDGFSDLDGDIQSAISGPASSEVGMVGLSAGGKSRKRKRPGEKRPRGPPSKAAKTGSLVNGSDARSTMTGHRTGATVDAPEDHADDEDEDEEDTTGAGGGRVPMYEGGQMTQAERDAELARRNAFYESVPEAHKARYDSFNRAKLQKSDVRKLVNATLNQSVPQNVVLLVNAYAKLFAGGLIEEAREVQGEWEVANLKRADNKDGEREAPVAKDVPEFDRGPLLPAHLREALRRYKKRRAGGPVGFTGLSLEGRENTAPRMGGRRLFR